ncbi:DUF4153 domain-containing protein [Alterisphingorhabdus coralli]|uniref:DUF4153 domain-containing protein n=1 Tax=Alterisphingorhabdus coralli TaxID=3071408 RepID=A0AA97F9G8_9SPHN|nr:DUF4153 domain-containing protein [Parasphingorhabdus sp. SCSIO 66989]WOE76438.1 DUF4153 domain-containing protein [Parasphingorhabdus sp. SCSIO 66989]
MNTADSMSGTAASSAVADTGDGGWPLRPWLLSLLLGICGLLVHIFWQQDMRAYDDPLPQWRAAGAAFFFFGGLGAAFALEQRRILWSVIFALIAGAIIAAIAWWVSGYWEYGYYWNWSFAAGVAALLISVPLFQTIRDNPEDTPRALPYDRLHFYSWSDVVVGAASMAFLGASWLLLTLISVLFQLINIDFIQELMREDWFGWVFSGLSFGAALGVLRENAGLLGVLQRVALIVLSILAPFLAAALALFLISLLFTGLDELWAATKNTTPILISCAVAAVILANAVIRNSPEEASQSRLLKISAMILALTILPLAVISAVSIGLRIDQHGFTPERFWVLLIVAIASAYGLAYLACVALGRSGWSERLRPANVRLSVALCVIALLLAMPFVDFGAWSARDQLARLESGAVSEEDFDYYALARQFGPTGRAKAEEMAKGEGERAKQAQLALDADNRWEYDDDIKLEQEREIYLVQPDRPLPEALREKLLGSQQCKFSACKVIWDGESRVFVVGQQCDGCPVSRRSFALEDGQWRSIHTAYTNSDKVETVTEETKVEIRTIERRQVFVDGKAVGDSFE